MKICGKCGAHNTDERVLCVDCSTALGAKLTDEQEKQLQQELNEQLETMYNKRDPLYVSRFDKIVGVIALVGAFAALAWLIIGLVNHQEPVFPFLALPFFLLSAVEAFIPQLLWAIEKVRLQLLLNGDVEPGLFYWIGRKIVIVLTTAIGVIMLLFSYL